MRTRAAPFPIGWILGALAGAGGIGIVILQILPLPETWQLEVWPLVSLAVLYPTLLVAAAVRRRSGIGDVTFLIVSRGIIISLFLVLLLCPWRALPLIWLHQAATFPIVTAAAKVAAWRRRKRALQPAQPASRLPVREGGGHES